MTNWEEKKFGDLYLIPSRNGLTRPSSVRGAGYKFINMGEIFSYNRIGNIETELVQLNEKEKKEMTLQKNDLLFARQSLVFSGAGKCSIMLDVEDVVSFESHLIRIRLNPEIANPMFYYYYFSLPYNSVKTIVQQCAQAGIRGSDLEKIKVPCPHIEIQNQIADILSTYDDLIEANNRRIELLEQTAQELYKEWFVRFRFPGYESIKFEKGIPEDWNVSKLSQISDFVYGKMPQQEHVVENGFPIFSGYRISGCYDSFMFEEPMLVLIARGVGGTGEVKISPPCAHITNLAIVFKLNNPDLHKRYLYHMFTLQNLRYLDTGAAQSQITIENLKNVKVILPTDGLLEKFNKIITPFYEEQDRLKSINENLISQRDLLLPRLMSGKLEV